MGKPSKMLFALNILMTGPHTNVKLLLEEEVKIVCSCNRISDIHYNQYFIIQLLILQFAETAKMQILTDAQ